MMNDTRPIIGFNGQRGKRFEWEEFDVVLKGAIVTFQRREVSRDGLHERIIRIGNTADGRHFRTREFYAI
jgi:hypothetical protein